MKFCWVADQWNRILDDFQAEAKILQYLMVKSAKTIRIESLSLVVQDLKEKLEAIFIQQRNILQAYHQNFMKSKDEELENAMRLIREVTQECLSYVDLLNPYVDETSARFMPFSAT